uniref:G-protein coupled receptors family 1 profile domain-containing protein n=1 Tax=Capitella teleta TaxID=283909 RepID=X2B271_CAPTE
MPIIVFFGTIGNGLSIRVLLRRRMRGKSVYIYLLVLSCSDTAVLYFSAFKTWIYELSNWELLHVSTEVCKVSTLFILVALHCSSWLIVLVTIDRSVAVWSPLRAASLCSLRQAWCMSGLLILASVVYNAHVLWTFSLYY